MEKLVFKNAIVNLVIGGVLIILAPLGYFLGWFEDFLPIVIGALLILVSAKRFWYTFKKITSKYATLILIIEFVLDIVFAGLMIYLRDHVNVFLGLIVYIRGISYLLINYVATRKIKLPYYILNIGFVTLGAYLMFGDLNSVLILSIALAVLILLVGAIYLYAGLQPSFAKKQEQKRLEKASIKKEKEQEKTQEKEEKKEKRVDKLEEKIKKIEDEHKQSVDKKAFDKNLESKTVPELKALAKESKVLNYSVMTKPELIAKLKELNK